MLQWQVNGQWQRFFISKDIKVKYKQQHRLPVWEKKVCSVSYKSRLKAIYFTGIINLTLAFESLSVVVITSTLPLKWRQWRIEFFHPKDTNKLKNLQCSVYHNNATLHMLNTITIIIIIICLTKTFRLLKQWKLATSINKDYQIKFIRLSLLFLAVKNKSLAKAKESMEQNWNFWRVGCWVQTKKTFHEGYGYFLQLHNSLHCR